MSKTFSESRRASKNPYALMEELEREHTEEEAKLFTSHLPARKKLNPRPSIQPYFTTLTTPQTMKAWVQKNRAGMKIRF